MQNDGNLVLYGPTGAVWASNDCAKKPAVPQPPSGGLTPAAAEAAVTALYQELLGRDPDPDGLATYVKALLAGLPLDDLREILMDSREYREKHPTTPPPTPVPPSSGTAWTPPAWWVNVTEAQLRNFRGDLGGMRVEGLGPDPAIRPSAPRDYVFTPTFMSLGPAERAKMLAAVKQRGYTHLSVGPIWERGYPGFRSHNFLDNPDGYIALLREIIDAGIIPVIWLMVDGPCNVERGAPGNDRNPIDWAEVERVLTPIYTRPDFQQVCKVAVFGWEVTDNSWVKTLARTMLALQWFARVAPQAYRYWHAAANNGAPCDYTEDGEGCEGKAWRLMAPLLHGHFWQDGSFGGWHMADGRDPNSEADRRAQFLDNLAYDVKRIRGDHYKPGGLIGADGKVLDVIAGEYSAYFEYHGDGEAAAIDYGRLALSVPGVRGFLDGGPAGR